MYHPIATTIIVREEKEKKIISCRTRCKTTFEKVIYIFWCVYVVVNITEEKSCKSMYHLTTIVVRDRKGVHVITSL